MLRFGPILFFFLFFFPWNEVSAQADISMATHWYNRASYNPASIIRPDFVYLFSNARKQWTGINGSPTVFNIQASDYYEILRSGFGISLINDNTGLTHVVNPTLIYAYCVAIKEHMYLSLGLSFGAFIRTINASRFEAEVVNDPSLYYSNRILTRPDSNLGFELQSQYFFLGASVTHLFSIQSPDDLFLFSNHRYGYVYYKNSDSQILNYNFGIQVVNRSNLTVFEGHTMFRFKYPTGLQKGPRELFDVGATYRSTNQLTLLLGINFSTDLRIGYAYDYDFNLPKDKGGTFEFVIEYRIPFNSKSSCPGTDWYF